jgi:hypothetical protein
VNPPDTPRNIRLAASVTGAAPRDYAPFSGPEWQPIVPD